MKKSKFLSFKHVYLFILLLCLAYIGSKFTFSLYESYANTDINGDISDIKLKINNVNIVNNTGDISDVVVTDITWTGVSHTRAGKISPGASGTFNLRLDPYGSQVAIIYKFTFVDKTIDPDKILTFTNITASNGTVIRTGINEYSGIISLNDINNGQTIALNIDFEYVDEEDMEPFTEDSENLDDFFTINFDAKQYNGEALVPYTG